MLIVSALALMGFLGATYLALTRAAYHYAETALRDRMESHLLALVAEGEIDRDGVMLLPDPLPDPRLLRPNSGLYAAIFSPGRYQWESDSAIGHSLPWATQLAANKKEFRGPIQTDAGAIYVLAMGTIWEGSGNKDYPYTFNVVSNTERLEADFYC
jgi:two-component system, OmpR family, sensor histidine kinase PhoQ